MGQRAGGVQRIAVPAAMVAQAMRQVAQGFHLEHIRVIRLYPSYMPKVLFKQGLGPNPKRAKSLAALLLIGCEESTGSVVEERRVLIQRTSWLIGGCAAKSPIALAYSPAERVTCNQ